MKRYIVTILIAVMAIQFFGCSGGDYAPKPQAYLRIDMPEHNYLKCDTSLLPFTFDYDQEAALVVKKDMPREKWIDLAYPDMKGIVYLTYRSIKGAAELQGQIDTSYRLISSHFDHASGVDEKSYEDPIHNVYAATYRLKGQNVASTYQFWATDSNSHFLRGALYLNYTPNNDSLAPIIEYIQADLTHLLESLRWR